MNRKHSVVAATLQCVLEIQTRNHEKANEWPISCKDGIVFYHTI